MTLAYEDIAYAYALAHRAARKWRRCPFYDDLVSAAMEATVVAAERFDASRGIPLRHYLATRVKGAVIDEFRRLSPGSRRRQDAWPLSLERYAEEVGRPVGELRQLAVLDEDVSDDTDVPQLRSLIKELRPQRRWVLEARLAGCTQDQIAAEMGVSVSRICQIEKAAIHELRAYVAA